MKHLLILSILLFSCSSPFRKAHEANSTALKVAQQIFDPRCKKAAQDCFAAGDKVCNPLLKCQEERAHVAKVLKQVEYSILNARTAYQAGNVEDGDIAMAKTRELMLGVFEQIEAGRK